MAVPYKEIGEQFTKVYYSTLDNDRSGLGALYVRVASLVALSVSAEFVTRALIEPAWFLISLHLLFLIVLYMNCELVELA